MLRQEFNIYFYQLSLIPRLQLEVISRTLTL